VGNLQPPDDDGGADDLWGKLEPVDPDAPATDEPPKEAADTSAPFKNTGEMMKAAKARLGADSAKVCKALGVAKPGEINKKELPRAWALLVAQFGPERPRENRT